MRGGWVGSDVWDKVPNKYGFFDTFPYMYLSKLLHVFVTTSSQIDKKSKTANKRGSVFLVQYNGTWANGKWDGAGVS